MICLCSGSQVLTSCSVCTLPTCKETLWQHCCNPWGFGWSGQWLRCSCCQFLHSLARSVRTFLRGVFVMRNGRRTKREACFYHRRNELFTLRRTLSIHSVVALAVLKQMEKFPNLALSHWTVLRHFGNFAGGWNAGCCSPGPHLPDGLFERALHVRKLGTPSTRQRKKTAKTGRPYEAIRVCEGLERSFPCCSVKCRCAVAPGGAPRRHLLV